MSVYHPDAFQERVTLAASYIGAGRETTRTFDTCFEMYDGDAVAIALYRRSVKNPDTALARNLWRYLCRESVVAAATKHAHETDLAAFSQRLRDRAEAVNLAAIAYRRDLEATPTYHDGTPRKRWHQLGDVERESWIRNPTPRSARKPEQLALI